MVKYYGRARTRTGSVNTNQLGLKMSGCPSTVGKQGRVARYMGRRVDCMMGLCKPIRYHEVIWPRTRMRNQPPFCRAHATKCLAAAGGVGTTHGAIPYYRTPAKGESGCTPYAPPPFTLVAASVATGNNGVGYVKAGSPAIPTWAYQPAGGSLSPTKLVNGVEFHVIMTCKDGPGTCFIVAATSMDSVGGAATTVPYKSVTVRGGDQNFTLYAKDATVRYPPSTPNTPALLLLQWYSLAPGPSATSLIPGRTYSVTFS